MQTIPDRANQIHNWLPSDSLENYSSKDNLYKIDEFSYSFNSNGFRCDDFTQYSELPIVFLGCSCTEGIGLPLEQTWSHILYTKVVQATNKKIPYWNLALGGTGIDTQASLLYWISKTNKFQHVFGLLPPFMRREYKLNGSELKTWLPNSTNELQNKIFIDQDFCNHQSYRSLMIIDSLCNANQSTCNLSYWGFDENDIKILSESNLNYLPWQPINVDHARDKIHYGPTYHSALAEYMWEHTKHYF